MTNDMADILLEKELIRLLLEKKLIRLELEQLAGKWFSIW